MKRLFFFVCAIWLLLPANANHLPLSRVKESVVYICNSAGATKYHLSSTCRGLNACESDIIKVTKEEAADKGKKTLCGWED